MRIQHSSSWTLLVGALFLAVAMFAAPGTARAHGEGHAIGVGATRTLAGVNGATFVYDPGAFRIVGLLGFQSVDQSPADDFTGFALGGQFLFNVHSTANSDFSLGGGLTLVQYTNYNGNNDDETNIDIEGLAQIRAFIVPNVALSASLGLLIATGDNFVVTDGTVAFRNGGTVIAFGGQVNASVGLTYFF